MEDGSGGGNRHMTRPTLEFGNEYDGWPKLAETDGSYTPQDSQFEMLRHGMAKSSVWQLLPVLLEDRELWKEVLFGDICLLEGGTGSEERR